METKIEKNKGNLFMSTTIKKIKFPTDHSDLKSIEYRTDQSVILKTKSEILLFSKINKTIFKNDTGEEVIELSGLATDGKEDKSWAIAYFEPSSSSPKHHHKERTEIYYVTSGRAKLSVDDRIYELKTGDSHIILPGQKHQITNLNDNQKLEVVVDCTPAWIYSDHHLESIQDCEINDSSKMINS